MGERAAIGSLPGWVLKMREAITASRANLDSVNYQIDVLKLNTVTLGEEILRTQNLAQVSHKKAPEEVEAERQVEEMRRRRCHIARLNPDCLFCCLQFLTFDEIVGSLDAASKMMQQLLTTTAIWQTLLLQLPHLHARLGFAEKQNQNQGTEWKKISRQPGDAVREIVRRHWIDSRKCVAFIREMKNQRAVPRHKSVAPRRYTSQDVTITHPLPVFENSSSAAAESSSQQVGRVMSRAETLDKDFRIAALGAMEAMAELTAYPGDIHARLVQQSAVSVFVSLLANEAQQLQYLSCSCLANLLCWDGHQCAPGLGATGTGVKRQMELCEGSKILLGLLTSPSASINLAGNLRGGASTAPIEGMCNREGARALVNLCCPFEMRVPPAAGRARGQGCPSSSRLMHELVLQQWPRLRAWKFWYFTRSGALKDEFTCYLTFSPDGRVLGRGCDSVGFFLLEGFSEIDIQGGLFKLRKQYLSESALDELTSALSALVSEQSKSGGAEVAAAETLAAMTVQRAHVMHTAYYCDGLQTDSHENLPTLGLYGVWEGASSEGSHFLLQKGGVFRAAPLAYC